MSKMQLHLEESVGAVFSANVVSLLLTGIILVQCYLIRDREQSLSWRSTLLALWFLDAVHTFLVMRFAYTYIFVNFVDSLVVNDMIWLSSGILLTASVIDTIVRGDYIRRLLDLARGKLTWLATVQFMISIIAGAFGSVSIALYAIKSLSCGDYDLDRISWLLRISPFLTYFSNVYITVALCGILTGLHSASPEKRTWPQTFMRYTMWTNAPATLGSIVAVFLRKDDLSYIIAYSVLPKVLLSSWIMSHKIYDLLPQPTVTGVQIGHSKTNVEEKIPMLV
ncbi:hypothetical protein WOLCODRAFT_138795 [Wolfiporia cocos MD-104 SS10]|uniref:Uncharacterized protein n=1 Tax=Wolfiporia cocos (strain MD-104) TaxID=742152 RepID=A0A2H3JVY7_WOLCO|nr:hypothetical protein WOLCODRAFT_138795 [Wolfiporia cocos MD-104 SS10]